LLARGFILKSQIATSKTADNLGVDNFISLHIVFLAMVCYY